MAERYQFRFKQKVPGGFCPYCCKPVGYIGLALAWALGTGLHGCDFSNVKRPGEP